MKKLIVLACMILLLGTAACADVIAPSGMGQIGYDAVVLCQSLTVRAERSTSSRAVTTLRAGDVFATQRTVDGWCDCFLSETAGQTGWVRAEYVAIDPGWFIANTSTPVYPWNEETDLRVGLLDKGERHPILKVEGEWLLIGLRGAAGWIHDAAAVESQYAGQYVPSDAALATRAELMTPSGKAYVLTEGAQLQWLRANFGIPQQPITPTKCPFDAVLNLALSDGRMVSLTLATDDCNVYRTETGLYYRYGTGDSADSARQFWALFGLNVENLH